MFLRIETNAFFTVWMYRSFVPSQYQQSRPNRLICEGRFNNDGKLLVFAQNGGSLMPKYRSQNLWQHDNKILMWRSMSIVAGSLGDIRSDTITISADNICLIDSRQPREIVEVSRKGAFKKNSP